MICNSSRFSSLQSGYGRLAWMLLGLGLLALSVPAFSTSNTAAADDLRQGVLYGKVVDAVTGKPVPDATVALQDSKGKVILWSKTNAQGEYALAANPVTALQLNPSRRQGLLEQVCRAVGNVVTAPIKAAGAVVTNPGKTIGSVAVSVASGATVPVAAATTAPVLVTPGPAASSASQQAGGAAAQTALGLGPKGNKAAQEHGAALITVSLSNYKSVQGMANAYWLEAPQREGPHPCGLQAWLSTTQLAPTDSNKNSQIAQEALLLSDAQVDPSLVPPGATVKLQVRLQEPAGTPHAVRVFAREMRKNMVVELKPGTGNDSTLFTGTMTLDPKMPIGDTAVTMAALRSEPVEVHLDKNKPDPLVEFVRRLDDMQANKPYLYDPRIMASQNRVDLKVTVLNPKQGTAAPVSTPAAPGITPNTKPETKPADKPGTAPAGKK